MQVFNLDARDWQTPLDFYDALKSALSAPEWCSSSLDAIMELMVWGLGGQPPPYVVQISGVDDAPREVREEISLIAEHVQKARAEIQARDGKDVDVSIKY
ncbi:MAG: hypothetical protein Q8K93_19320 [Reyranella sp.]|nr:hypothetical protein [Reyranella sp.]